MNKALIISLVVVAVVVAAWAIMKDGNEVAGPTATPTPALSVPPTVSPTPVISPSPSPAASPTKTSTPTPVPTQQSNLVTYTNSGYSPATITVKKGQTITWKNNSSSGMWTASAIHPTHKVYPTTGGCIGSTFDACTGIPSGGTWSFKFDVAGTWKYHNHMNPSHFGTIIVEP